MGWNSSYTIFEATVVGAYDLGKLDKELLSVLMEPYRGSDIDSGGSRDIVAKDGLNVEQIVLKVWGIKYPKRPNLPENYRFWTPKQDAANEAYYEKMGNLFRKVTKHFDWR